ncbi:MAG: protein kinase [Candidatus Eisenbacteria bacterium]|nr:protein kinase [Candidatus Eisenbacteria bacterium]
MSRLTPGVRLGHYLIESPIGAGGMGEVYQARDTRLDRLVAIKVIPPELADTPEARARFEREARVISSLNHPHICTLFDVGREDDIEFLVMEFLEGETLAKRLQRGPLSIPETGRIAAQVADALDRAHRQGITHRDLKPANIMLTKGGAKLLDFGLARGAGLSATTGGLSQTPTMTTPLTTQGAIVGTLEYMAPEQLEGKETDARTDLWAMGLILYEMLTGRRPFQAPSQAGLIAAILERTPTPVSTIVPDCPPGLVRLVDRCLTKDPDDRWQSARDLMHELRELAGSGGVSLPSGVIPGSSGSVPTPVVARKRFAIPTWALLLAAFGIGAAAMMAATTPGRHAPVAPPLLRFEMEPGNGLSLAVSAEPALAPDGRRIAFCGIDSLGTRHLCVRSLDNIESRLLPGTERANLPFWSPDGEWIAYFADEGLRKVRVDGGSPVLVAPAPDARGGVWLPNDDIIFAPNRQGGLHRVSAGGGQVAPVTRPDTGSGELGHRYPSLSSDGRNVLFASIRGDGRHHIQAVNITTGGVTDIGESRSAGMPVGDYLLTMDGSGADEPNLQIQRLDSKSLRLAAPGRRIVNDIHASNIAYLNVAASSDLIVVQRVTEIEARLEWRDMADGSTAVAGRERNITDLSLSPDGRRVAMVLGDPFDVWVRDLASGGKRRLTFDGNYKWQFLWSPDGRNLLYSAQRPGSNAAYEIRIKSVDGVGPERILFQGPGLFCSPVGWLSGGRELLATASDSTGTFQLYVVPMTEGGQPRIHDPRPAGRESARLSPDGRWLAYLSSETGRNEAFVESFPEADTRYQASSNGALRVEWVDKGHRLAYIDSRHELWTLAIQSGSGLEFGPPRRCFPIPGEANAVTFEAEGTRVLVPVIEWQHGTGAFEAILGWQALIPKS